MRKSTSMAALCAGLFLCCAQPAMAQTMEFSCPAPGTKFTFNNGFYSVSQGQSGMFCIFAQGEQGTRSELYAMLHSFNEQRRKEPAWLKYIDPIKAELIWPLSVGKAHKGSATVGGDTYALEYKVVAYETVQTPFGAEEAFRIEMKETGSNGYRADIKWWISPKYRAFLKTEFANNRGQNISFSVSDIAPR